MTPQALEDFLSGPNRVLQADAAVLQAVADTHSTSDRRVIHVTMGNNADKTRALEALARAFDMPRWFGHNWDALEDCLTDLEWLPDQPIVALLEGTLRRKEDADTLIDIVKHACAYWQGEHRRFHVVLDLRLADQNA